MKLSDGVEWCTHACTLLAVLPDGAALPAAELARYHGVPPAYLAKHLQACARAGIVETVTGPRGGYRLARPPAAITVLDVVEAIDGVTPAFRCAEIRRRGPTAAAPERYTGRCGIHRAFLDADVAWRDVLRRTSIADLVASALAEAPAEQLAKAAEWLDETAR